jgi:hypothetical protein
LAALVGGALWVIVFASHALSSSAEGSDAFYVSFHGLGALGLLSVLLVAVGLVGLDMHMPFGSVMLLIFDTEGLRAWFGVPYGAAWIAVGYLLFLGRSEQFQAASRVR